MSFFNTFLFIPLLCVTFLLIQPSHSVDPLYNICSGFSSPPTTEYKNNLNTLLKTLTTTTPPTGFSLASIPKTSSSSSDATAYGLALCRGDTTSSTCKACLTNATTQILKLCPDNKGAIIWYDNCLLKYSGDNFFGQIDTQNKFTLINVNPIGNNPDLFKKKVKDLLMNQLLKEAISSKGERKALYAAGKVKLDTFTNLYGLVQCTRDLSVDKCKKCLDEVIGEFPDCCDAKQGGRVVAGSCNFRYEIYPFVMDDESSS